MSENESPYALGTEAYTLGDVFLTAMLTRCYADKSFFTTSVRSKPHLSAYWDMVQARPSFKEARMTLIYIPGNFLTAIVFVIVLLLFVYLLGWLMFLPFQVVCGISESKFLMTVIYIYISAVLIFIKVTKVNGARKWLEDWCDRGEKPKDEKVEE